MDAPPVWPVGGFGEEVAVRRVTAARRTLPPADVVVAFHSCRAELERSVPRLAGRGGTGSAWWLAWPRRAGGHPSDLTDGVVRAAGLAAGLVDVKVAALDHDWSALRFVRRRAPAPEGGG